MIVLHSVYSHRMLVAELEELALLPFVGRTVVVHFRASSWTSSDDSHSLHDDRLPLRVGPLARSAADGGPSLDSALRPDAGNVGAPHDVDEPSHDAEAHGAFLSGAGDGASHDGTRPFRGVVLAGSGDVVAPRDDTGDGAAQADDGA